MPRANAEEKFLESLNPKARKVYQEACAIRALLELRPKFMSPPVTRGTTSNGVTGTQGPTRWREGGFSPGPRQRVARTGSATG